MFRKQHKSLYLFLQFILSLQSISLPYNVKNENGTSLCSLPDTDVCVKLTNMEVFTLKSRFDLILITKYHDSTKLCTHVYIMTLLTVCNPRLTTLWYFPLDLHPWVNWNNFISFGVCPIIDTEIRSCYSNKTLFRFLIGR